MQTLVTRAIDGLLVALYLLALRWPVSTLRQYANHRRGWRRWDFARWRQFVAWGLMLILVIAAIVLATLGVITATTWLGTWSIWLIVAAILGLLAVPCSNPKYNTEPRLRIIRASVVIFAAALWLLIDQLVQIVVA